MIEPAIPAAGARLAAAAALPIWRRVVISYVAAVSEEIVFRLLLLSCIAGVAAGHGPSLVGRSGRARACYPTRRRSRRNSR